MSRNTSIVMDYIPVTTPLENTAKNLAWIFREETRLENNGFAVKIKYTKSGEVYLVRSITDKERYNLKHYKTLFEPGQCKISK